MKDRLIFIAIVFVFGLTINAVADPWDNGDDTGAGATSLSITTNWASHGPHTLTNGTDVADWFSFYLEAGKRYRFESTGTSDTAGYLYGGPSGFPELDYQDYQVFDAGEANNFQILYTPVNSGTYYLKVEIDPYASISSAEYDLQYVNESALDQWDPVDDASTSATFLSMATTQALNGVHTLGPNDTNDWFRFVFITGVVYTIESSGGWDTSALLYDEGLSLLIDSRAYDYDEYDDAGFNTNFKIEYAPASVGVYHLNVQAFDPGYDINYSLLYQASADPDTDGEGQSDVEEFIAGTNPSNSASYFAITNWSLGSFVLEWPAVAGRQYQVYHTDNLTNSFSETGGLIYYPQNSYTGSTTEAGGFYKVEVQLQ